MALLAAGANKEAAGKVSGPSAACHMWLCSIWLVLVRWGGEGGGGVMAGAGGCRG